MRRGTRRPQALVSWLPIQDVDLVGSLAPGTLGADATMYDFTSSGDVGSKFGGGDWIVERIVGDFAISAALGVAPPAGETDKLIRICVGIGMLNVETSVLKPSAGLTSIGDLYTDPQVSWMLYLCCEIRLGSFNVERCDINVKSRRIIGTEGRLIATVGIDNRSGADIPDSDPTNGTTMKYNMNVRTLVRHRKNR